VEKIDCLGDICPVPIVRLQEKLPQIKKGKAVLLVTDHSCTRQSVSDFCKLHHLQFKADEVINGVWEIGIWMEQANK
jgi:tRNA 2-thiouridine synthesizing protein A